MKIKEKILLSDYSTFRIGGPAKFFVEIKSLEELKESIEWARSNKSKFMILGGGSNVLFHDNGFDGLVIRLVNNEIRLEGEEDIYCQAGVMLGKLVSFATENSLTGMEWAAGIPGTVGGAIRGNAGAFGKEMKDVTERVAYFNLENLEEENCGRDECKFDYRQSVFKEFDNKIIWEATFNLKRGNKKEVERLARDIMEKRRDKHPCLSEAGSAGCIFKNPTVNKDIIKQFEKETGVECKGDKVPAGWLIDMCGMKGYELGPIQVSDKQANFIVNKGKGRAENVIVLISLIKQKVRNTFGVQLEEEVVIVGE